jgi:4-diphosphocytidyl-2-C-methyl-D-erythritol kinase
VGPVVGVNAVTVAAPVKLTLSLRVSGVRPDGFHELDALCVRAAPPADTVTVRRVGAEGVTLTLDGPTAAGLPTDAANLAAAAALRAGASGLAIHVHKEIPAGGGLGGGSADAAAVLAALEQLDGSTRTTSEDLDELAAAVGSDVPVCLRTGLVWMRGRGEVVVPAGPAPAIDLLIVTPAFGCSTPAVYREWDRLGGPTGPSQPAPAALADHLAELRNDLEPAALAIEPRLGELRAAVVEVTGRVPLLAGSGSSYVVLLDGAGPADLADRLRDATGAQVWRSRVIP